MFRCNCLPPVAVLTAKRCWQKIYLCWIGIEVHKRTKFSYQVGVVAGGTNICTCQLNNMCPAIVIGIMTTTGQTVPVETYPVYAFRFTYRALRMASKTLMLKHNHRGTMMPICCASSMATPAILF